MKPALYLSFDIESDGRSPAYNSMISLGVAAFVAGSLQETFKVNVKPIAGRGPDLATMEEFWSKWPEKWASCQQDAQEPSIAMPPHSLH